MRIKAGVETKTVLDLTPSVLRLAAQANKNMFFLRDKLAQGNCYNNHEGQSYVSVVR